MAQTGKRGACRQGQESDKILILVTVFKFFVPVSALHFYDLFSGFIKGLMSLVFFINKNMFHKICDNFLISS